MCPTQAFSPLTKRRVRVVPMPLVKGSLRPSRRIERLTSLKIFNSVSVGLLPSLSSLWKNSPKRLTAMLLATSPFWCPPIPSATRKRAHRFSRTNSPTKSWLFPLTIPRWVREA
ncbi:MAG: hypothetical protein BWY86_00473 [Candidatus Aminicenantes bacterium ADurb.Bin508]|nr:MAG: hypothetical protein BWY86_00473 [Candidatus Aminicenantes bacterium ADurb.Bin508]